MPRNFDTCLLLTKEKKTLEVRRDDFVKGSPDNDWEQVFGAFSEEIRKNVGDEIHGLLTPDFSTTGPSRESCLSNCPNEYVQGIV